jgi:hypothetical protein
MDHADAVAADRANHDMLFHRANSTGWPLATVRLVELW